MRTPTSTATIAALVVGLCTAGTPAADVKVPGFKVDTIVTGLVEPTSLAFAPDGRLFVGERGGTVRIIEDGRPVDPPFASIEAFAESESGLLGIALHPDFQNNRYVYIFATVTFREQHIIRFTEENGVGVNKTLIREFLPTTGVFHSGGCIRFGPDGMLYFSIGDIQNPALSQDMNSLAGKICRVRPEDGSPAPGNPFTTVTGAPRSVYALGFRNSFRFCFAPDGRMFVMDVGSNNDARREEMNLVYAGDNCGWPNVEGIPETIQFPEYTYPIVAYHDEGTSPVGVVYYTGDQFPPEYAGNVFHLDYVRNKLFRVVLSGDQALSHELFMQGEGGTLDLIQGPDGSLVYCEFDTGTVKSVRYTAASGNEPTGPTIATTDDEPPRAFCGAGVAGAAGVSFLLMTPFTHPRRRPRS